MTATANVVPPCPFVVQMLKVSQQSRASLNPEGNPFPLGRGALSSPAPIKDFSFLVQRASGWMEDRDHLLPKRSGNQGVVSYVMSTAYTFGYSELGIVLTNNRVGRGSLLRWSAVPRAEGVRDCNVLYDRRPHMRTHHTCTHHTSHTQWSEVAGANK